MLKFYGYCIFCFKELPTEPKGEGEHIIPKNIYGFWRTYDVCEKCKEYFGDNVDQLPLKDIAILNAMKYLNLPNADKLFENLPYIGTDTIDKSNIQMIRKDGDFKIKVTAVDNRFLECSEDDWDMFGIKWLEDNVRHKVTKQVFDKEIEHMKNEYKALNPGDTVHSDILGYSIRKRQTYNVEVDKGALPAITKLIAKIVVCFLWLVLSPQQIAEIPDFEMLVKHARSEHELRKYLINWCSITQKVQYHKFHRLRLHTFANTQIVDITLFGYPNWRTVLKSTSPIILKDSEDQKLEEVQLILDFEDLENRKKYIGFRYADENQPRYHELYA